MEYLVKKFAINLEVLFFLILSIIKFKLNCLNLRHINNFKP